jgi:hypothetical protein
MRGDDPHHHLPGRFRRDRRHPPLGSVGFEAEPGAYRERTIWLEAGVVDRLAAMRGSGASYSDVILRMAAK